MWEGEGARFRPGRLLRRCHMVVQNAERKYLCGLLSARAGGAMAASMALYGGPSGKERCAAMALLSLDISPKTQA